MAQRYFPEISIMKLAPREWGVHRVPWGYTVTDPGSMAFYQFDSQALIDLERFNPDIIYVQNEVYCAATHQLHRVAKRLGCRFAVFVWENISPYQNPIDQLLLKKTDLVVCGNGEAEALVKPWSENTLRCIQVGVNTDIFQPKGGEVTHDIIYQGRLSEEKGVGVLRRAVDGTEWRVLWPQPNFGTPYKKLPERYAKAKVYAAPSLDTSRWKEQHAGYSSLEALACGLYVATSDSSSIVEALKTCPGVTFSRRGDPEDLRRNIDQCLGWYDRAVINSGGQQWVKMNYGYEAIARRLIEAFRRLMN